MIIATTNLLQLVPSVYVPKHILGLGLVELVSKSLCNSTVKDRLILCMKFCNSEEVLKCQPKHLLDHNSFLKPRSRFSAFSIANIVKGLADIWNTEKL